jgi:hypothetical protein
MVHICTLIFPLCVKADNVQYLMSCNAGNDIESYLEYR